ncbi:MAG TPA: 7TM diverse intracellular signaling domain-containing protein, partial [Leptospiraceae bacterium]|nr:7TM diverse intracellular signaling domain-containing protein [Leptospiraceae bacterium]
MLRLILILISFGLFFCKSDPVPKVPLEAKKGILDLKNWDFQKDGNVYLDGEWTFSFEKNSKGFTTVPSQWQDHGFPLYGTAEYGLKILLPEKDGNEELAILLPDISMSYDLYADGIHILSTGKTGNSKEDSSPFLRHRFSALKKKSAEMELRIRVSNFHSTKSGILGKIKLGSLNTLRGQTERSRSLDYIVFGCLLIMAVHNISIYLFRKKDKVPLFFGMFCILIALRTVSVNECCILDYFPDLPFLLIYKLEYAPFYMGVPLFAMFLYSLFPREFTSRALRIFKYSGIPLTAAAASSPIEIYIRLLPVFELTAFLFAVYSSVTVFLAMIRRRPGAKLFCAGGFPFFWTIINDLLLNMQIIYTFYMGSYGFLIFIYFHSVALSKRFSRNITFAEMQSEELQGKTAALEESNSELFELKENLEKKVQERTLELEKARQITEEANQELQDLNKFTKLINSAKDLDYILNQIYDYIRKNMELGIFWLILYNNEKNELYNYKWILPEDNDWDEDQKRFLTDFRISVNPGIGTLYQTFASREIFYLPDIYKSVSGSKNHFINEFNGKIYFSKRLDLKILTVGKFESFVQIPLTVNDRTIGILNLAPIDRKTSLERRELFSLIQFGEQIAGVIQNMHLLEETEKARQESALQKQLAEKTKEELEV